MGSHRLQQDVVMRRPPGGHVAVQADAHLGGVGGGGEASPLLPQAVFLEAMLSDSKS